MNGAQASAGASAQASTNGGNGPKPIAVGWKFQVTIDKGFKLGMFTGCEGLGGEVEVFEWPEGGQNSYVHRLPGRIKYPNLKLTRRLDPDSAEVAKWFSALREKVERHTAEVVAYDPNGKEVAHWNLKDVYPVRWTAPSFSIDGNEVAKETLELAHNGFST
jgi:phage tail-like protein